MDILTDIGERVTRLAAFAELTVPASELPASVIGLSDASVVEVARELASIASGVARMQALVAGVAAHRSRRENGHAGLAATQGHSTPASLIQAITGGTKADATRQVRVGAALLEDVLSPDAGTQDESDPTREETPPPPWHASLRDDLMSGRITTVQHDVIRRGLGEPRDDTSDAAKVWSIAAAQLSADASTMTAEDLAVRARAMRDALDPVGAEERFARRYEKRSFRMWVDQDGQHRGSLTFDDEAALWVRSIRDAALRPRRGGPRFMTDEERAHAAELHDDPRSNEQLEYDLLMSTLRAGALAEAKDVFGARQPGVRMIVVNDAVDDAGPRDAFGRLLTVGYAEDGGQALPGSVIDRNLCMHGAVQITQDWRGNPLDVGREARLFTPRQRIALAARDGGCMWPGCPMPASYSEAHHIDHYVADHGNTDIDRGILLCTFHHLLLHNRGWKITRDGKGPFLLHPPPGEGDAIPLSSKATWRWAWMPPPRPPEWRAA
ncbi:DUF222 domain-containing protein [Microbacterium sp.]|uniref:HNH endonuclease signature motif containing protein n=1 Tax=Microbacterium sp. TaxID=51671 RepID=UPI0039E335D8